MRHDFLAVLDAVNEWENAVVEDNSSEIMIFIFFTCRRNELTASSLVFHSEISYNLSHLLLLYLLPRLPRRSSPFLSLTGSSAGASGRRRCTETMDTGVALAKMHEDGSAPVDVVGGSLKLREFNEHMSKIACANTRAIRGTV